MPVSFDIVAVRHKKVNVWETLQVHGQIVQVRMRMRFIERLCVVVLCLSCVSVSVTDPAVGSPLRWTISKGHDFKEIPKAIASRRMQFTRA